MQQIINGYTLYFNTNWNEWHVTHSDIGFCGWFTDYEEAKDYCDRG